MLSDTAGYALRAVLYIAGHDGRGPVPAREVAKELSAPRNYLSKILHVLAREGVLVSTRGPGGGFRLARRPEEQDLLPVVAPFEELEPEPTCLLGRPECSDADPCPAHRMWREIMDRKREFLLTTTVAELLGDSRPAS